MKFLNYFLFFLLLSSIIACNDKNQNSLKKELTGTWEANGGSISSCDDFDDNRPAINYIPCPDSPCLELTFRENGEIDYNVHPSTSSYQEYEGDYTVSGSKLTICLDAVTECFIYTAAITNAQMTLTQISGTTGCVGVTEWVKEI